MGPWSESPGTCRQDGGPKREEFGVHDLLGIESAFKSYQEQNPSVNGLGTVKTLEIIRFDT
jgi:hypothetical protein